VATTPRRSASGAVPTPKHPIISSLFTYCVETSGDGDH
jgi:hypothetical protein